LASLFRGETVVTDCLSDL